MTRTPFHLNLSLRILTDSDSDPSFGAQSNFCSQRDRYDERRLYTFHVGAENDGDI